MVRSVRSSSSHPEFLATLADKLESFDSTIARVLGGVVSQFPADEDTARRYLLLYGLPVLEFSGCLSGDRGQTLSWATAQTALGVHLRHIDDVLDGDCPGERVADTCLRSAQYLDMAKALLARLNAPWTAADEAVYQQMYLYEVECRAGHQHDLDSLWRRVSPLCVLTERLRDQGGEIARYAGVYRHYLAWSLLEADADDSLKDYAGNIITPVTRAIRASAAGAWMDWRLASATVDQFKSYLAEKKAALTAELEALPLWTAVLSALDETYRHEAGS